MEIESIKKYLQNYFNFVLNERYSKRREERGLSPIEFQVYDIIKGSYQPPIIHVFLDSEPEMKKSLANKPWASMFMNEVERDIENFMKSVSIEFKIKVHWNKRPIFNNETLSTDN
jgi:hypothetical protein